MSPQVCNDYGEGVPNLFMVKPIADALEERHMRKSPTLELVQRSTGREPEELLRELYVERRHSDQEIAEVLTRKADYPIGRATVQAWRAAFGITRDDRPAVAL
jgi:hypothetical protein